MNTFAIGSQVGAMRVLVDGNLLHLFLTDGRAVILPFVQIPWLCWLAQATPEQRDQWSIEPGGFAVYWEELDNGFEVAHALSLEPVM